jgi:uncharacterized protein YwlG (UPF0340 family)|tara:strand:+ start:156 stop:293 length:138 start_codon:yes stop_codon:yes gene_type:complete
MTRMTLRGFIEAAIGYAKGIVKKTGCSRAEQACQHLQNALIVLGE